MLGTANALQHDLMLRFLHEIPISETWFSFQHLALDTMKRNREAIESRETLRLCHCRIFAFFAEIEQFFEAYIG